MFGCDCIFNKNAAGLDHLLKYPWFIQNIKNVSDVITNQIDNIIITIGADGIIIARKNTTHDTAFFNSKCEYIESSEQNQTQHRFYKVEPYTTNMVNVSGAGDSFDVGFITAILRGHPENISFSVGMESARAALSSESAVPNNYFSCNHKCWQQPAIYRDI